MFQCLSFCQQGILWDVGAKAQFAPTVPRHGSSPALRTSDHAVGQRWAAFQESLGFPILCFLFFLLIPAICFCLHDPLAPLCAEGEC